MAEQQTTQRPALLDYIFDKRVIAGVVIAVAATPVFNLAGDFINSLNPDLTEAYAVSELRAKDEERVVTESDVQEFLTRQQEIRDNDALVGNFVFWATIGGSLGFAGYSANGVRTRRNGTAPAPTA